MAANSSWDLIQHLKG